MPAQLLFVRFGIAVGISLLGLGLYWGWNRFQLRRLGRVGGGPLHGLEGFKSGVPGILYFTTPECQVCLSAQKPALARLEAEMGAGVQVVEVDASARHELADYWGVLSVPTTFIIDGQGRPRSINHGLTNKEKLRRQIEATRQNGTEWVVEAPGAQQSVESGR